MVTIPISLRHALESGECVLFVGAGIGEYFTDIDGKKLPRSGAELAGEVVGHFGLGAISADLTKIAELLEIRKKRKELEVFLQQRLADPKPDAAALWIPSVRWKAIFTTNYDRGLERAYEVSPKPLQQPISISITSEVVDPDPRFEIPIYHLHGAVFDSGRSRIIITRQDYAQFAERRRMLFDILRQRFATSTFLYLVSCPANNFMRHNDFHKY